MSPSDSTTSWIAAAVFLNLGFFLIALLGFVHSLRRKPSIDAEFATKPEVQALKTELKTDLKTVQAELKQDAKIADDRLSDRLTTIDRTRSSQVATIHEGLRQVSEATKVNAVKTDHISKTVEEIKAATCKR